jgi:aldehyde:ferredoxin oxidoreductase
MEKKIYGYAGKQLRICLDNLRIIKEDLDEKILRKYLGAVGYSVRLLYNELDAGIDPLGSKNRLIFATGPLSHPAVPGGGSIELCYKSPLTNAWGESRVGGEFGFALKKAGYDYLIIEGIAEKPSYIVIDDDDIEIRPGGKLVGKTTSEKEEILREKLDNAYEIMTIGPAGENKVLIATVMLKGRAAGRTGAGAVMGSKNILAVAVKGTKEIPIYNPEGFKNLIRKANKKVKENPDTERYRKYGTTGDILSCDEAGDWPTKNWQSNSWGKGNELYAYFHKNNLIKNYPCYRGCPVACGRYVEVKEGKYKTPAHAGAEYESISTFTAFVLNKDIDAAVHSTYLCNEYGIDTISTGSIIAFIMDCYDQGIVGNKDVENLDLSWGNAEILPILVKKIAFRDGLGNSLADGVKRASEKLSRGAEKLAVHGKGLEAPAHDPRSGKALAVTYGTGNRGMCHIHPVEGMTYDSGKVDFGLVKYGIPDPEEVDRWDEEGKGAITKILQDGAIVPDIVGTCKFFMYLGITLDDYADFLSKLTGWELKGEDLILTGERVSNLQRMFNVREGFGRREDNIPERMCQIPKFGIYKDEVNCVIKDYEGMLDEYYQARGWDQKTGIPSDEKLKELEIEL